MTVTLYKTSDDPRVVNKTLTAVGNTISATAKGNFSIISPTLILDYTGSMTGVNYFYITDFGRYYYITDISLDIGGRIVISGAIDVLKTYATGIGNATATVIRSESVGKPTMIPDSKLPVNPNTKELKTAYKSFTPTGSNLYLVRLRDNARKYVEPND